jgi:hypothetical protein
VDRDANAGDPEVLGAFLEGGMGRRRQDHLRRRDAALAPGAVPRRLDREQDALGAPLVMNPAASGPPCRNRRPSPRPRTGGVASSGTRRVERVRREEASVRFGRQGEDVGTGVIRQAEGATRLPVDVPAAAPRARRGSRRPSRRSLEAAWARP